MLKFLRRAGRVAVFALIAAALLAASVACSPAEGGEQPASSLELSRDRVDLLLSGEYTLEAVSLTVGGEPREIGTLRWNSEDGSVAAVSAAGVVTAVGTGETSVTAEDVATGVRSEPVVVRVYEGEEEISLDSDRINYYGRVMPRTAESVMFYNTASAFEVRFIGSSLKASLRASAEALRVQVYVDGEAQEEQQRISTFRMDYTFAVGLADGVAHTVRVFKVNSANKGNLELNGIATDGAFVEAPEKPGLKFEFYGDSITAGYGVNAYPGEENSIRNEDGTATFAYLASEALGAQVSIMCYSGMSAVVPVPSYGYEPDSERTFSNLYGQYAPGVLSAEWDFSSYQADVVFVCLGTNDYYGIQQGAGTNESFVNGFVQFVSDLRAKTPEASIVLCYGMMHKNLDAQFREIVRKCGDPGVYYLPRDIVESGGYNGHPGRSGQKAGAEQLVGFLHDKGIC